MSQENVEVVRGGFEAFARTDVEAWLARISPSIAVYPNPAEPGTRTRYDGWDGVVEYLDNWFSGWEEYTVEPLKFIDAGDYVVVGAREVGVSKSGIRIEQAFSHTFKLRAGQIVEWRQFGPLEDALEAAGLPE